MGKMMRGSAQLSDFASVSALWYFCLAATSVGEVMFGMDGSAFGSLQVLPSFLAQFGTKNAKGAHILTPDRRSLMTSVQWIGKIFGTIIIASIIQKWGYRKALVMACAIQFLAVSLEIAAREWKLFSCGRVFCYLTIAFIENIASNYAAETAPASLRGFAVSCVWISLNLGRVVNQAIFRGIADSKNPKIWMAPIGAQFGPPIVILSLVYFIAESPRWLVSQGKEAEACRQLSRLRKRTATSEDLIAAEIAAISESLEQARASSSSGRWLDLFRGNNLRRTHIAVWTFIFNQWTGNQFVAAYGPTFLKQFGLSNTVIFDMNLGYNIATIPTSFPVAWMYDRFGRRPLLIYGTVLSTVFLIVVGTVGDYAHPTGAQVNVVAASFIIFQVFNGHTWSQASYIVSSEIGTALLRKKTMGFATTIDVIAAFGVTYSSPYSLAKLGTKTVWIFVAVSIWAVIFSVLFLPETNGRSLEEMDEMFDAKLWAWQFKSYQTTGVGHALSEMERHGTAAKPRIEAEDDKLDQEFREDTKV